MQVESAALITSIQDSGRTGYLRFGLPPSGPMDWWAFRAANRLVGNPPGSACMEIGMTDCSLRMAGAALVAVCGAGYRVYRDQHEIPLWMSYLVKPGDRIQFIKTSGGSWAYLAVHGGIQSEAWLGSRSIYSRGSLGRCLQDGDELPVAALTSRSRTVAGRTFPVRLQPSYSTQSVLRVIAGPETSRFTSESLADFYTQAYQVSTQSDRMGYRLDGPSIRHTGSADVVSRGMAMGEIQVPGSGQPIVMMADHPTTGGYTSLGAIARVDWPLLAQSSPGEATIRFTRTTLEESQKQLTQLIHAIDSYQYDQEDQWIHL